MLKFSIMKSSNSMAGYFEVIESEVQNNIRE